MLARSATSSGKHSPPRSWSVSWKRDAWIRRLCGLTSPPSTLGRGVALWMESLAASLASLGVLPESGKARTTSAGSGPSSLESFARLNRHCASSKTCLDLFQEADSSTSFLTLPNAGSMRSGVICQRPPLALRMSETASGSWPSSRAEDSESCGNHPDATDSLTGAVRNWPTPDYHANERINQSPSDGAAERPTLALFSKNWKTPHGLSSADGGGGEFQKAAEQWMTPNVPNGGRKLAPGMVESKGTGPDGIKRQVGLENQTEWWASPRTLTGGANSKRAERGAGGPDLQEQVEAFSRPVLSTLDGAELSPTTRILPPRLNPAFAAWLMGLPGWWTSPGVTSSVRSAMEAYRFALRSRLQGLL